MPDSERLDQLIDIMARVHGRDLSSFDHVFLAKIAARRQKACAAPSLRAYTALLSLDSDEALALWTALGITYSEFFRDSLAFAALEQIVLPVLLEEAMASRRPELRVWSAACAGGQEAYSVAILLEDLIGPRQWRGSYRIFATDVGQTGLAMGQQGVYETANLQKVRLGHLRAYFQARGASYQVADRLRERVEYWTFDLLDRRLACPPASIYGDFDLVLCSNVLFYYRPELRRRIVTKVVASLRPGGFLMTGQAECAMIEEVGGLLRLAPIVPLFRKPLSGPARATHHDFSRISRET